MLARKRIENFGGNERAVISRGLVTAASGDNVFFAGIGVMAESKA